jgi:hypothetical protein
MPRDLDKVAVRLHVAQPRSHVHHRYRLGRSGILVLVIVALTAASAAAARWAPWSPLNSCLFCGTPDTPAELRTARAERDAAIISGVRAAGAPRAAGAIAGRPQAEIAAPLTGVQQQAAPAPAAADSRHEWQPWGTGSAFRRDSAASTSGLGGLSRLMSPSNSGGGSTVNTSTAAQEPAPVSGEAEKLQATPQLPSPSPASAPPSEPGPPAPPASNSKPALVPPAPGGYTPPTRPTVDLSPPPLTPPASPPTEPFHEHETPPPPPFVPLQPTGPLDTNGPTATLPTGGTPSPNPEPGSILLLGTGVIALLGALRRRRML